MRHLVTLIDNNEERYDSHSVWTGIADAEAWARARIGPGQSFNLHVRNSEESRWVLVFSGQYSSTMDTRHIAPVPVIHREPSEVSGIRPGRSAFAQFLALGV